MIRREVGAWTLLAAGALCAGWVGLIPLTSQQAAVALSMQTGLGQRAVRYPADSFFAVTTRSGLFRSDRRPTSVGYDPNRGLVPDVPAMPKPVLSLVGLVAGERASAVIEGFPGIDGSRVVRAGDLVAGFRIMEITRDAVTVVGMDTTWVLRLRESWK